MKTAAVVSMCVSMLVLVGCGGAPAPKSAPTVDSPDPEKVCDHTAEILEAEIPTVKTGKERESARKACIDRATAARRDDPPRWSCEGTCMLAAKTFTELHACDDQCKAH